LQYEPSLKRGLFIAFWALLLFMVFLQALYIVCSLKLQSVEVPARPIAVRTGVTQQVLNRITKDDNKK